MQTYRYYVGANNDTKQVERAKIEQVFNQYIDIQESTGYWKGSQEPSAIVEVANVQSDKAPIAETLKRELNQDDDKLELV